MFLQFSGWLSASTVASACQSVLSTEAMLSVLLGSGSQTWNYVGRDVLGQLGGLLVMSGLTKQTDKNPRQFLWMAHAFQQSSMALLLCTPVLEPTWFMPVAAMANICSNVSFIAYGSMNAKCIQKLSERENNVGELYSKLTVTQTLASSAGLCLGMIVNEVVGSYNYLMFFVLGGVRVFCCNQAVKKVL